MPTIKLKSYRSLAITDRANVLDVIDDIDAIYNALSLDPVKIPIMTARRLSKGSKLALLIANTFLQDDVEALVFSSRHGELMRSYNILEAINTNLDISPTDFSMSVHNACASQFLITNKLKLPYSSVAASEDTFLQGLFECLNFLGFGYKKVLYIDFDSRLPEFYEKRLLNIPSYDFATAFLFTGFNANKDLVSDLNIEKNSCTDANLCDIDIDINKLQDRLLSILKKDNSMPMSLAFINYLKGL